jgi:molecular chaperone GrpE
VRVDKGTIMDENELSAEEMLQMGEGEAVEEEEGDVESLKRALAEEQARAEGYLASWQRAQADFANFKRRTEQERNETVIRANAALVLNMLPVLDDLERALDNISEKLSKLTWVDGIVLIYRKLKSTLEANGLSEIKALGETFDPNYHEAALYDEGEEGKVIEELQKGYMLHDRVLRPAMVKVGKGLMEKEEEKSQEEVQEENNG